MAKDNLGITYENRTLKFYGYAYGSSNVVLTATINDTVVFNGEVPTSNEPVPTLNQADASNYPLQFTVADSALFPTNWSGAYPMTITVSGGTAALFGNITSNYMPSYVVEKIALEDASIAGNVLTVGTSSGVITPGMFLVANNVINNTTIISGSGLTWIVNQEQTVSNTTMTASTSQQIAGNATDFLLTYTGVPTNSEGTIDPRSSVMIDGVTQVPPSRVSTGTWVWLIPTNNTISYNLNVALGNCAQV